MVSLKQYLDIIEERPYKFNAEQVEYGPAPEGSVMRCNSCIHYFRRSIDGFATCEIFRDAEVDANGVRPDFRCAFWTVDAAVHPLIEEPEEEPPLPEEETISY
jgi:hypothetical protein